MGRRTPPASGRALHLHGGGEAHGPDEPLRVLRLLAFEPQSLQPQRGVLRLRQPADGAHEGRGRPDREEGLRRRLSRGPRAVGTVRPGHRVDRVPHHAPLRPPARVALRGRSHGVLRAGNPAVPLLDRRYVPDDLHRLRAARGGAHRAGPRRRRVRRGDRRRAGPRHRLQDHRARADRADRPRPAGRGLPQWGEVRPRDGPRRRAAGPDPGPGRRRRPRGAAQRVQGPERLLLPARPALDQRPEDALRHPALRRRIPARGPVGGPDRSLPDRQHRLLRRRHLLRHHRAPGGRLVGPRDRAPAGARPPARHQPRPLPPRLPRPLARQVDPLLLPRVPRHGGPRGRPLLGVADALALPEARARGRGRGPRRHVPLGAGVHLDLPQHADARRGIPLDLRPREAGPAVRERVLGRPAPDGRAEPRPLLVRGPESSAGRPGLSEEGQRGRPGAGRRRLDRGHERPHLHELHARAGGLSDDDRLLPRALRRQPGIRPDGGHQLVPVARAAPLPRRPRRGAVHGLRPPAGAALPQVAALLAGEGEGAAARRDPADAADHERLGALAPGAAAGHGARAAGSARDDRVLSPRARHGHRELVRRRAPLVSRGGGGGSGRGAALLGRFFRASPTAASGSRASRGSSPRPTS